MRLCLKCGAVENSPQCCQQRSESEARSSKINRAFRHAAAARIATMESEAAWLRERHCELLKLGDEMKRRIELLAHLIEVERDSAQ